VPTRLRWYLMSSPILRGGDLRIATDGKDVAEVVRQVLMPIWNAYSFFVLYANADGRKAQVRTDSTHVLDRYVLAKTRLLVESVTDALDSYRLADACAEVLTFIDALNNWYIRRSRERFWGGEGGSGSSRRPRHPLHRAHHPHPGGRTAPAHDLRGDPPEPHR
jgi:isoleucyl-tRNA synthetase